MKLDLKSSIVLKKGSRLLFSIVMIVLAIMLISIAMVFLFFYDFKTLNTNVFFPAVICIIILVFTVSLIFQALFFKMFGGGKIIGIYSKGITELCFVQAIKRNAFFVAHFLSNLVPLLVFVPFAVIFWNGIMFFALCGVFGNLVGYIPLYFVIFKHNNNDLFRFERDGVLRVYTLVNNDIDITL